MENLENLEKAIKKKDRTKDDIIKYLLESKKQMKNESIAFVKTEKFEIIKRKLRKINNQ